MKDLSRLIVLQIINLGSNKRILCNTIEGITKCLKFIVKGCDVVEEVRKEEDQSTIIDGVYSYPKHHLFEAFYKANACMAI